MDGYASIGGNIAGLDKSDILSFEAVGLVLIPNKTGILVNRGLRLKAVNIANSGGVSSGDATG